jgi:hypothetical protein
MTASLAIFESDTANQKQSIVDFERELLAMPQIKLEAKHYFAKGLYARELFMPKGSAVTGKIHIKEHICIISYGDVTVADNEGTKRLVGPCTFVGRPGSKRALYMHEDTLWTAIHSTDLSSVEECEATLVTNDYEEFLRISEGLCLTG